MDIKQAAGAYNAIANIAQNAPIDNLPKTAGVPEASFSDLVTQALGDAVDTGHKAEKVSTLALMGKADLTQLAISVGDAEDALNTVIAIRDKVVSAYQQIMQMPM